MADKLKVGQRVMVIGHTAYADLSKGATITPMRQYQEGGFETTITAILEDDFEDENDSPVVVVSYETPMGNFSGEQLEAV